MLIAIDGPEKAGKTTFVNELRDRFGYRVRKWNKPEDVSLGWADRHHAAALRRDIEDVQDGYGVVWDRSWASEWVYGTLMNEGRPISDDPWLGEWWFGRAVQALGVRMILLGPGGEEQFGIRTPDDQPVDPTTERELFRAYGNRFGWAVFENQHSAASHEQLLRFLEAAGKFKPRDPARWAGPKFSDVVVLGEARSKQVADDWLSWMPFGSRYTTRFARQLGDDALRVSWTNVEAEPALESVRLVVACGKKALRYAEGAAGVTTQLHHVPHPSWLYRWAAAREKIEDTERAFVSAVKDAVVARRKG
jgi:hypothetical protein